MNKNEKATSRGLYTAFFFMSSLNLCTGRPPTGVVIPDTV